MVVQNGMVYFAATEVIVLLLCMVGLATLVMLVVLVIKVFKLVKQAKKVVEKIDKISDEVQDTIAEVKPTVEKCNQSLLNINSWVGSIGGIVTSVFAWARDKLSYND